MKKILAMLLVVGASAAQAATVSVCTGSAGKVTPWGASGTVVGTPTFVKTGFEVQCSNNVMMSANEVSSTLFVVGSASKKGNQRFGGNSNGGAIKATSKCSSDPCTSTDVTSALSEGSS